MPRLSYRYRPIHAVCEKLFEVFSSLLPVGKGNPLADRPKKVLVLKFGGMGEAILARSLVEHLRRRNPSMIFDFLVETRTLETMTCGSQSNVILYNPRVDGLGRALATLQKIRRSRYDAILDFEQCSTLTASFARATSIPVRVGFTPLNSSPRERLFTHPIKLSEAESMWNAFLRLGRILDSELPGDLTTVPLPYSPRADAWAKEWWNENIGISQQGRVIAMHLGVGPSAQYRCWPTERFAELASRLRLSVNELTIVLTGGQTERRLMEDFIKRIDSRTVVASDLGGLERTAALLQRCDLLISNDTGVMHLGAAMGTPTVGVFGASNPVWWAPVGSRATHVYTSRQSCSPCIDSYRRQIPSRCIASRESACMWDISVSDVLKAITKVTREPWAG